MENPLNRAATPWSGESTMKTRSAIQRSVNALLDELAPQRVLKRADEAQGPIQQYRAPSGCVLQAATCAVSISWFADATPESAFGELHIRVWQGTVTRRGGHRGAHNAVMLSELVLRPIETQLYSGLWGAADGTKYDSTMVAAKCSGLLGAQMLAATEPVVAT
jgi:hypothetical protein